MKEDAYFKLVKNYSWRSVFFRYFAFIALSLMTVICVFLIFIRASNNNAIKKFTDNAVWQSFYKKSTTVNQVFSEVNRRYNELASDSEINIFLCSEDINNFESQRIYKMINSYINTTDCWDSVYIYGKKSGYVLSNESSNYIDRFYYKAWYDAYEKADKWFYAMAGKLPMNMDVITCIYDMSLGLDDVSDGIFAVNINMNNFERLIFEENSQQYEKVYLVNSDGIIIYSNDRSMLGKNAYSYANLNTLTNEEMSDNLVHGIRVKNKMYNGMVLDNEIKMMMETDLKYYSVDTSYEKSMFLGALLFSVFITLFLSFYISMKFYKTIASIIFQIEDPLLNMGASGKNKNEVSYITANMIGMIKSNEQMENVLLDKVQMLKKAQIIALQTQLNPHFLFNTLNLVNVIVMRITKGENDAARVIRLLCDLLNVSLDTKTTIVTIGEEIEYTKKYLEIESIKRKNSFDIVWNIDKAMYGFKTIKFILQPIVENAIEHGIKFLRDKRGTIDISGRAEKDIVIFTVKDNGPGMSKEQLVHITEIMDSQDIQESRNIGLSNVQRRIRLIYGEKYGIGIKSDNDGTEVRITFPKNSTL